MANILNTVQIVLVIFCLMSVLFTPVGGQTSCSIRVPVPSIGFCDAISSLEENVEQEVYETRGMVKTVKEFQDGAFELSNKHINDIVKQKDVSDANMRDLVEEINTLKRFMDGIVALSDEVEQFMDEDMGNVDAKIASRFRRASTMSATQLQQLLDTAKQTFQNAVIDVNNKIQNMTLLIASDLQRFGTEHAKLLQEAADNGQDILQLERDLNNLNAAISKQAANMTASVSGGGTSLSSIQQDVMDLRINATVAEMLAQRQLDQMTTQVQNISMIESLTSSGLSGLEKQLIALNTSVTQANHEISNVVGAEKILETQINGYISSIQADLSAVNALLPRIKQTIDDGSKQVFNYTIEHSKFESDLRAAKVHVDSVQTLISYSTRLQIQQSADILMLRKEAMDDINTLKYAFGIRSTMP